MKKILLKYKNMPIQLKASFWFTVCGVLQSGLGIITLPFFTRFLTTSQYGLSSTYFAWYDLATIFCTWRLSYGAYDKGMIKFEEKRDSFTSEMLGLAVSISSLCIIAYIFLSSFIRINIGLDTGLCLLMLVSQLFAPAYLFWSARNKYEYNYKKFTLVTLLASIGVTIINIFVVRFVDYDKGLLKILGYQLPWNLVYLIIFIYIFSKGKSFYNSETWRFATKYNLPLLPYFLSTIVLDKADRLMIDYYCGKTDVALYSVSYNIGRLMVILTVAIDATITPWMFNNIKREKYSESKKISLQILLIFSAMAILFMLFAPELLFIFASSEYKEAVYIIPSIVSSYFFVMIYHVVSKVEFYFEKTQGIALVTVISAVIDILLNLCFIPKFGYIAAGYTTLASYIVMAALHMIYSYVIAKSKGLENKVYPWGKIIILALFMVIVTAFVNLFYGSFIIRYVVIALILAVVVYFKKTIYNLFVTTKNK